MVFSKILRPLSLLLVISVISLSLITVNAESIDISNLTNDELIVLLSDVNQAVVSRGLPKTAQLPKGTYIAGQDLPCGSYVYTCLAKGNEWGNVTIYSVSGNERKQLLWEVVIAPKDGEQPEKIFMRLKEGDELKSDVAFSLSISAGLLFQ